MIFSLRPAARALAPSTLILSLAVSALFSVAGLAQAQPLRVTEVTEASHPFSAWRCGGKPVKLRMIGSTMEVVVDGESRLLRQVVSAAGARYVAPGDAATEFWGKGGQANLVWSGNALPVCADADTFVIPLRASGNEPFWAVEYDGWQFTLTQPGEPARRFDTERQAAGPGAWALLASGSPDTVRLDIREAHCVDTMSGMTRPYSTTLTMNEQTLNGCGGDPERLLQGVRWQLKAVDGQPVNVPAWLEFLSSNRLTGSNGCNRLMGSYVLDGEALRFSQLGSTRMACQPEIMVQAAVIDRALSSVRGHVFDSRGGLRLMTDQGDLLFQVTDAG